jgi:integrase
MQDPASPESIPMSEHREPKLLDRVRSAIRVRHYSRRTEKAYVCWVRRFVLFHGCRHPSEMGQKEIAAYLSHLAEQRKVSASTQNQALSALLFLYREVLETDPGWVQDVVRAKRPVRVPVVLSAPEVAALLEHLHGAPWLVASLLYGSGCGCWRRCGCGSRTSTSRPARSRSGTGRARRTAARCCRGPWSGRCGPTCGG